MNSLAERHSKWVAGFVARQGGSPITQRQTMAQLRHGRYATEPQYPVTVIHHDKWDPLDTIDDANRPQEGQQPSGGAWYTVHLPGDEGEDGVRVYAISRESGAHSIMSSPGGRMNGLGLSGVMSPDDYGYLQSQIDGVQRMMPDGQDPAQGPVKLPTGEAYIPLKLTGKQLSNYARTVNAANRVYAGDASSLPDIAPDVVQAFGNTQAAMDEVVPRLAEIREKRLSELNDADPDGVKARYVSNVAHMRRGERLIVLAQNQTAQTMLNSRLQSEGHSVNMVARQHPDIVNGYEEFNWMNPNEYTVSPTQAHVLITDSPDHTACPYMHHLINYDMPAGAAQSTVKPLSSEFLGTDSPQEMRTRPGMLAPEVPGQTV